ncbi:MAG: SDR family NAD(P)-dependent oxidoreductase [Kiritimatiellales bacterium]
MMLNGKVALVTGGANGIGKAVCELFNRQGARVIVCDFDAAAGGQLVEDLSARGTEAFFLHADLSRLDEIEGVAEKACKRFGRLDVLVNNAGICNTVSIDEMTMEQWDRTYGINIKALFLLSRAVVHLMRAQGNGKIINLGSMAGRNGGVSVGADYSSSKAAVINLTRTFAGYAAKYGIQVNSVVPGVIRTRMSQDFDLSRYNIPLGRMGTPEDVAGAILFLASEFSDYMTGSCVDVNGGFLMS